MGFVLIVIIIAILIWEEVKKEWADQEAKRINANRPKRDYKSHWYK